MTADLAAAFDPDVIEKMDGIAKAEAARPEPDSDLGRLAQLVADAVLEAEAVAPLAGFTPSESGQAAALELYTGRRGLAWSPGRGWLAYDPLTGCWRSDVGEQVAFAAVDVAARARSDLRRVEGDRKVFEMFARDSLTYRSQRAVLELLSRRPNIWTPDSAFDAVPDWINCRGFAVPLREGLAGARPALPPDFFTRSAGCRPEPGPTPVFDQFLAAFTCDRADLAAWLLRWLGLCLTGDMTTPFVLFFWGSGKNAKSTFFRLVFKVFGSYAATIAAAVIVDDGRPAGVTRPELCALNGPRLGVIEEAPAGRMNIEVLKRLTGNDRFYAAEKYKAPVEFSPVLKPASTSNERLSLARVDPAMRRRIRLVPCELKIEDGAEDPGIENRLATEGPAILARLIDEAVEYYRLGGGPRAFPPCQTIDAASFDYLSSEDLVGQFLTECCVAVGSILSSEVHRAYVGWAEAEGHRPLGARTFSEALVAKGFRKEHSRAGTRFFGLQISPERDK